MDQKEHVATLCALGTVGAAAAGLAFGTRHVDSGSDSHLLRPGKRKWPGSSGLAYSNPIDSVPLPRRSISQPITSTLPADSATFVSPSTHSQRYWSAPRALFTARDEAGNDVSSSRASSTSRRSILRPRTATSRSTTDKRESSSSSNWMKRLSSFSSHNTSPASSITLPESADAALPLPTIYSQRPSTSIGAMPNKLVKRSVSQRGLSHDEARGQILRRPATSHQRSHTFLQILSRPLSTSTYETGGDDYPTTEPVVPLTSERQRSWRPFFETAFPRKRRRSDSATDGGQIRVVSLASQPDPIMLLGSELDDTSRQSNLDDQSQPQSNSINTSTTNVRRSRRSLSSLRRLPRKRNFTDPSVSVTRTAANGTISPVKKNTINGQTMNGATFNLALAPPGTSLFTSSPPLSQDDWRSSSRPYGSVCASDPPTTSSDADGRVFSDEESVDFQSDTAYDSVATRATDVSHSRVRDSKLETIFAARTSDEMDAQHRMWQALHEEKVLNGDHIQDSFFHHNGLDMRGIGIAVTDSKETSTSSAKDDVSMVTPPRSPSLLAEDMSVTPVPMKGFRTEIHSSPPLLPTSNCVKDYDQVGQMLEDMKLDEEEIDWSTNGDSMFGLENRPSEPCQIISSPSSAAQNLITRFQEADESEDLWDHSAQKTNIFEWSEHQHVSNFSRPKTVHGKQSNGDRSRSSGRKGPPQLHFRSQSVPVNRDGPPDDLPTTSKFQTWRLGYKPVSEEWSDDFEFDDVEELHVASPVVDDHKPNFRDSVRSVRIPQAIIDRQPSVHLQFGQVQEFMALVEELKRLRSKGSEMHILDGTAKYLWEDAESIVNLATINDEESHNISSSPPSSDPFAEIAAITPTTNPLPATRGRRTTTTGRRSVSTMTTPPVHGRARGESLAQARHFLQAMHQVRSGFDSSPREIEIHQQKKLPFDTQDLKDLVVRSGVITRALKEEIRRAEGVSLSPHKTPPSKTASHVLSEIFRAPEPYEASSSPCPPSRKPALPKSRSANGYLEISNSRQQIGPFSSPIGLATIV